MRVTNNLLINNLKNNISNNIASLEKIQNQLSTGQAISKPSDDPAGLAISLRLSSQLSQNQQFQENTEDAMGWIDTTDDALSCLTSVLQSAYELTVEGANGTMAREDREAIAAEVSQLLEEAVDLANTTFGDRYIFGGTNTKDKPYDGTNWNNNNNGIQYEVGVGIKQTINVTADEVFKSCNLLETLGQVVTDLNNNDGGALTTDIGRIQDAIDNILACRSKVGASSNRLQMTKSRLEEQETNITSMKADVEGVDPAEAIMNLKNQENAYKYSLAVGAQIIQPTLIDFLR